MKIYNLKIRFNQILKKKSTKSIWNTSKNENKKSKNLKQKNLCKNVEKRWKCAEKFKENVEKALKKALKKEKIKKKKFWRKKLIKCW